MKKILLIVSSILINCFCYSQTVDEYPFEDIYEICGEETLELVTPENYNIIFWYELPFSVENNSLIHTGNSLIIDVNSPWANVEQIAWEATDGENNLYSTTQVLFLDYPTAQINIENYSSNERITICENDPDITLNATTNNPNDIYQWYLNGLPIENENNSSVNVLELEYNINDENYFYVEVTNICGTEESEEVSITINECNCEFNIPNAFTPDGDGLNDFFPEQKNASRNEEVNINCDATIYSMIIYDRLGRVVFNSKGEINKPWNGKRRNSNVNCKEGVYYYKIDYNLNQFTDQDDSQIKSGSVSIFRKD